MKNYITIFYFLLSSFAFSQIGIGKNAVSGSAILDFGSANKGIILPIADTSDTNEVYTNGTILMDKNSKKILIRQNGNWLELSDEGEFDETEDIDENPISTAVVFNTNTASDIGEGVIIGNTTSTASGILILESTNQALVLPIVENPHLNIPKPVAGTICYDSISNSLAVFDGNVWSYWK